jgi:hypothetical protein
MINQRTTMPTLMDEIEQLAERATAEIAKLEVERDALDTQIKRLRAIQKAMEPPQPKRGRPAGSKNGDGKSHPRGRSTLDKDRVRTVIKGILAYEDDHPNDSGEFSIFDIHEAIGGKWTLASTGQIVKHLRDTGFLGKMGKQSGSNRQLWKIIDREAGQFQLLGGAD